MTKSPAILVIQLMLCFSFTSIAQQQIGLFPSINGGYEAQAAGNLSSTASSSTPSLTEWARGGTSGSGSSSILTSGGRSGQCLRIQNTNISGTASPRTFLSPAASLQSSSSYVIQFYCKAADNTILPNTTIQTGISAATGTSATWLTINPGSASSFSKLTAIVSTTAITPVNGFAALKISSSTTNNGASLDVDDFVIYPGTSVDDIAPAAVSNAIISAVSGTTIALQWTPPVDIDGGGYLLVRYTMNPSLEPLPNVNGIYNTGNSIGNGQVVYIGTTSSFIDAGLQNNTTYYYRIFAVDKAFNYASPVDVSATTTSTAATVQIYIDATDGDDNNPGTIAAPWKNISKLNGRLLQPGTEVFLKCGSIWNGQKLTFKGSGTAANPIKVNKYGSGALPVLAGNGITGEAVVYLYNQQYIEVANLEITNSPFGAVNRDFFVGLYQNGNNPLGADRRGVMVALDDFGMANHIYLKGLKIHHVKGQLGSGNVIVNGALPKRTGGIFFTVLSTNENAASKSRFNDVLIDRCEVYYCENVGIAFDNDWNVYYPGGDEFNNWFDRRYSNVIISNNVIHHIGKNALILRCTDETGLVEKNICYETALGTTGNTMFTARAKGTVFQFNEGYFNRGSTQSIDPGNYDGSLYDADFGSVGIIFQYSYSHDNSEGLYWGCNVRSASNNVTGIPDPGDTACTVRYCISKNDLGRLVFFNYPSSGNRIYNNVFYTKQGLRPHIISENETNKHTWEFYNNIIHNNSTGATYDISDAGVLQVRSISHNLFFGQHPSGEPADAFKLTTDPLLINPSEPQNGFDFLSAFQLQTGSPAIASGKNINNNGGKDFYGNSLTGSICRGVYQGNGTNTSVQSLFSFSADLLSNVVELKWKNNNESTLYNYTVERSRDGVNFNPLSIKLKDPIQLGLYTFTDLLPFTDINYYRIKLTDIFGRVSYSEEKIISIANQEIVGYPNPFTDGFKIKMKSSAFPILLTMYDFLGRIIIREKKVNSSNEWINASACLPGMYIISVYSASNNTLIKRFNTLKR